MVYPSSDTGLIVNDKHFDVESENYFTYSKYTKQVKVSEQLIKNKKCTVCILVIAVYAEKSMNDGDTMQYSIEVTQTNRIINDHESQTKLLAKGSMAYYRYQCANNEATVYFDVSDNHQ